MPARGRPSGGKRKDVHERALGLLSVRQRSRRELERRLLLAGFDPQEVSDELVRLQAVGLVDDEAFAREVVRSRMSGRGESRSFVAGRLAQAGVGPEIVRAALDDAGGDEQEIADRLARTRVGRLSGLEPHVAAQRLFGYLARRGYPPDVARRAARSVLASPSDD